MITLFRSSQTISLCALKDTVSRQIAQLPQMVGSIGDPLQILRYEYPCEPINILSWLNNQNNDVKLYWSACRNGFEVGGLNYADLLTGHQAPNYCEILSCMEDRLSEDNLNLRYYGGFCFDAKKLDENWKEFGTYRFIIPQFEILQHNDEYIFAINIAIKDVSEEHIKKILADLNAIDFKPETAYKPIPVIESRLDQPDQKQWRSLFEKIMQHGELLYEKIVLARKSDLLFNRSLNPMALMKHLKSLTPDSYHFCFQVKSDCAFLGATPETLFKKEGLRLASEAIAGTIRRGKNEKEDSQFEDILVNSPKNFHEHKIVVDGILKSLSPLCVKIEKDPKFNILKLRGKQHLVTRMRGELRSFVTTDQLLSALHPTPAVGGSPKEEVIERIAELEPFSRGWYAAPVGYVGYDSSEFAVAIRSGLIQKNQLSLFAGAGIVEGSKIDDEWEEIEHKISNFLEVFNPESYSDGHHEITEY